RSSAASSACSIDKMPICSPSGSITRTGLIRICWLTRVRSFMAVALLWRAKQKTRSVEAGFDARSPRPPLDRRAVVIHETRRRREASRKVRRLRAPTSLIFDGECSGGPPGGQGEPAGFLGAGGTGGLAPG